MKTLLLALLTLTACTTQRELQIQKGIPSVYNGHIKFNPVTTWQKCDVDNLPDTLFRIRNIAVKRN